MAFGILQSPYKWLKIVLILGLTFLGLKMILQISKIKKINLELEHKSQIEREQILINEAWIKLIASKYSKEARQILENKFNESKSDRTWVIPLAQSEFLPANILTELSQNSDMAIVLAVSKNPSTPPHVLTQIYKNHPYPDYFFSALAENESTPLEVLDSLYHEQAKNSGIEMGLARNKNLPAFLAEKLLTSNNPLVIGELARHPQVPCELVLKALQVLTKFPNDTTYLSSAVGWAESGKLRCSK